MLGHIAVVGASLAGVRTAEALRRRGYQGELTLVGAEPHFPPYDRPPLSKSVLTGADPEEVRLRVDEDLGAKLRLGVAAVGLDLAAREVRLADGERLGFDGLVIATGGSPRQPPALRGEPPEVFVLRTLEDSLALRAALLRGPRVAVVGGGFIGCEIAAACRALGLEVTLVEAEGQPMERVLGPELGRELAALHRDHGTALRTGTPVAGLRPGEVLLADGTTVPADVVVVAIGCAPATAWLRGSGLDVADGVLLDERCAAVGAEGVVAAGDVARWPNRLFGETMRIEHWTNAFEQADAAARTLLAGPGGEAEPFAPVPYFWSDQYDSKIHFVGRATGRPRIVEGSPAERRFVAVWTGEGVVRGALCVNRAGRLARYRRMIANRAAEDALPEPA
ncbi:NAD(P)/FAD-dependent oxidoreductase [Streptomyces hoynatensis]|uniref:NAD(P)/FAD-dependent oxidoreductase n=1 Tax=Streptomyces hoynatensis TaxID=1141874 RepID=A0A3A9Z1M6_9ACTN|nr:FAD-dependent oxidoreductase [Streptomyces hoynatensis]RKN42352.1 NAD(P)/FAD-dependent oxidoreductase [Streptomyces hoynatensis]